jgi:putative transposase
MPTARDYRADLLSLEAKYGGMDCGEAKRLKQLEEENRKLKHVVAELTLDNRALKDVLSKTWW